MCGRYTLILLHDLKTIFPWITEPEVEPPPRYNIAPTQPILAARNEPKPKFEPLHWGLIPPWAKEPSVGSWLINARAETLAEKPTFRDAFRHRRCLIPADGFYEWRKNPDGSKSPVYVRMKDHKPFAFAGLWEEWRPKVGAPIRSCTIITTEPNELMQPIHDRMPAIVPKDKQRRWLARGEAKPNELADCLRPYPTEKMEAVPVSRVVNNPRNETPDCIKSVSEE
jgi:putative SOS response-associated peptidase YedK